MTVPSERNMSIKATEKLSKYIDLEIDIQMMLGMKTDVIPVIIGALGLGKYTNKIPGNINICKVQKIALLGTAYIRRQVLSINGTHSHDAQGTATVLGIIGLVN